MHADSLERRQSLMLPASDFTTWSVYKKVGTYLLRTVLFIAPRCKATLPQVAMAKGRDKTWKSRPAAGLAADGGRPSKRHDSNHGWRKCNTTKAD
jgi:hypothetical protein